MGFLAPIFAALPRADKRSGQSARASAIFQIARADKRACKAARADKRPGRQEERPLDAVIPLFSAQTNHCSTTLRPKDALLGCRVVYRPVQIGLQALLLSALAAAPLWAQTAPAPSAPQSLGVEDAVSIALRQSPLLAEASADVDAAQARLNAARADTRPNLSANSFISGGSLSNITQSPNAPMPGMIMNLPRGTYADQNLMLMVPVFTSGRLQNMTRQAQALRGASETEREMQKQSVALSVRVAYRGVQAQNALVESARARVVENNERLRVDRQKLEQSQIPAYYLQRDAAEVAAAQQELTNAQRDVQIAETQLKTVMGVGLDTGLVLTEKLSDAPRRDLIQQLTGDAAPETGERAALLRAAEQNRPELASAENRIAGAKAGESATRNAYKPQINAFVMGDVLQTRGTRGGGITYGLAASLPLYTGGAEKARTDEARAERRKTEAQEQTVRLRVRQEVSDAYARLSAAEQNIVTARAAQTAAQEEYQAAQARYDAGRSILTELLDAQTRRIRAEVGVVQALFVYNVSRDEMRRAVGDPMRLFRRQH